jgi:hypothetical protein
VQKHFHTGKAKESDGTLVEGSHAGSLLHLEGSWGINCEEMHGGMFGSQIGRLRLVGRLASYAENANRDPIPVSAEGKLHYISQYFP